MALMSLSMKMIFVTGFEFVGWTLAGICFLRGLVGYLGNLLDLAIYHLHVKNSPESVAARNANVETAPEVKTKTPSSPIKTLLYFAACLGLSYMIFHLIR